MTKGIKNSHAHQCDSCGSDDSMTNPELLERLQNDGDLRLKAMEDYAKLPEVIKRRVRALKNLRLDAIKVEEAFYKELSLLEAKYSEKYEVLHDKRAEIINGAREPTDLECEFESEVEEELVEEVKKIAISTVTPENVKGIPDFWLTVFQNSELIRYNIQEHDIPALKYLIDIRCTLQTGDEHGFTLEFLFEKNEYFSDEKLTKRYFVSLEAPATCPFDYDGPEIVRTEGCKINWNNGKNLTVKIVKKTQKAKKGTEKKVVSKVVKNDSFFNFFEPPTESLEDNDDEISPETECLLEADFELGQYIRERIIPRAVSYYTGEAVESCDEDEDEYNDESCDSGDDADTKRPITNGQDKPECKQQ